MIFQGLSKDDTRRHLANVYSRGALLATVGLLQEIRRVPRAIAILVVGVSRRNPCRWLPKQGREHCQNHRVPSRSLSREPFGRVKGGWVEMEVPLIPLVLSQTKGPTGHMHLRRPDGYEGGSNAHFDTLDCSFAESADKVRNTELFPLVIARTEGFEDKSPDGDVYQSLIVSPTEANGDTMRRMGILLQRKEHFGPNDSEARKAIKLVQLGYSAFSNISNTGTSMSWQRIYPLGVA
ncbi:hypothetical protein QQZ08_006122 [Neonectria magnoliae]|uniref:Uncharacterized protein n=1 Tax=Neonectria magnoliae TaxID=2732573 RepID=A0ABR1I364_9HYPO